MRKGKQKKTWDIAYVIVAPGEIILPFSVRHQKGQCIKDAEKNHAMDWHDMKKHGYYVSKCTINLI